MTPLLRPNDQPTGGQSGSVVYKRDASWHNRPRAVSSDRDDGNGYVGKYHWQHPRDAALARCGKSVIAEFTATDPLDVEARLRCRRPGCRQKWIEFEAWEDARGEWEAQARS